MAKIKLNSCFFIQETSKVTSPTGFQSVVKKRISNSTGIIDYNKQAQKKVFIKQSGANFSK